MKRTLVIMTLIVVLAAGMAPARAQDRDFGVVDDYIQALMAEYDVAGTSIALVEDGSVVYTQGYGVRSTTTGDPVTPDTLFCIGSVTKSVTAAGIELLVDQGQLDLDTPIIEYVPDFKLSDPDATAKLTLRHLLAQTSGLPGTDAAWYLGNLADQQAVLDHIATLPLTAQPGEKYQYDNYNYVLAGHVLEQVTGQTWEDFIREQLFAPLDMRSAAFDVPSMQASPNFAAPHTMDLRNGLQPMPFRETLDLIAPAGALNLSVNDLAQYMLFQLGDGSPVMAQARLDEMHTQQAAFPTADAQQDQTTFMSVGYSLGWMNGFFRGYPLVWHNGSIDGYYTFVLMVPPLHLGIAVLTNTQGPSELMSQVAALALMRWMTEDTLDTQIDDVVNQQTGYDPSTRQIMLGQARNYQLNPAALDPLVGDYTSSFAEISVVNEDGTLYLDVDQGAGLQHLEMVPFEDGGFLINDIPARGYFSQFNFAIADDGTITLYQEGQKIAQRLPEGVTLATYADPQGRFTVTIPLGLAQQATQPVATFVSADPLGVFTLSATDATAETLTASALALVQLLHPDFTQAAASQGDFQMPDGRTWTQYIYTVTADRALVVLALREGSTDYFITLEAANTAIQTLAGPLQELLLNLQITGE